ncbi:MAG: hypothetical protein ABIH11_05560 [Candidatus Altiarchaeota archaeon]
MNDKGQMSTIDLTVAFVIMLFIIFASLEVWTTGVRKMDTVYNKRGIDRKVLDVAESLVETPGVPSGWHTLDVVDSSTVGSVGFARKRNVLDGPRLDKASSMDYGELRRIMGLSKEEIHVVVRNLSDPGRRVVYEYGQGTDGTAVVVNRYGMLGGDMVEVSVRLYYPEGSQLSV